MQEPKLPWVKMIAYSPIALALTAVGVPALIPPFTPFGFLILFAAAYPYAHWMGKKNIQNEEYKDRDHSVNEGEQFPWETQEQIDEDLINIIINGSGRGKSND
jgi:hypothetical protein